MMRDFIVETADSTLNARLTIDDIDGNLFSGWKISGVRLRDAHGPVADIESIVLRYNIFRIPWKIVTLRELTLNTPRIFITRAEGRDWNISTLVQPSDKEEDTTASPFDWDIRVENLRILDGTLLVYDSSTAGPARYDRLDTRHMKLERMNLALSAHIRDEEKRVSINRFSWENPFGAVAMRNLSGDLVVRKTGVEVNALSVQTQRSGAIMSASLDSADVLGAFDSDGFPDMPMALSLDAPEVDLRDLQYFLPPLDILGDRATLELEAAGTLRNLAIETLELEAGDSRISFAGVIRDIPEGADMFIDVISSDTRITGTDIPLLLPGIPIMDLSGMGTAEFSLLRFTGKPLNFTAEMDLESDAGAIAGSIDLDLTGDQMEYDGMIRTRGVNLERVLGNPRLSSSLTVQGGIRGSGTRIGGIVAAMNLQVDSSRFQRYAVESLDMQVDVRRDSLTLELDSRFGGSSLVMDGGMSFRTDSITGFRLHSETSSFDLGRALGDEKLESDLTFHLTAQGSGIDPSSASGSVEIVFEPSRLGDITIEQDTFRLVLQQSVRDAEYLLLASQYADARIDGRFDFPRFFDYVSMQTDSLRRAMGAFAFFPDTSAAAVETVPAESVEKTAQAAEAPVDTSDFMDVDYSITLKNPERIARYFNASTFMLRGTYRGSIRGGMNGFDIDGALNVSDFYYVDSVRTWLAAGLQVSYDIRDLTLHQPLERLKLETRIRTGDVNINGLRLRRTDVQLDYADLQPQLRIRTMIDTLLQADIQAYARYDDYGIDVNFPMVDLRYLKEPWTNDREIALRIDSSGIAVNRFVLRHESMRFTLSGRRSAEGENSFTIYGDSLDVGMVEYLATASAEARSGDSFTGTASLQVNIKGTDAAPLMAADLFIDSLGYGGLHFGELIAEARYFERRIELYSELVYMNMEGEEENVFFISGTLPMQLALAGASEEDASAAPEQPANLRAQMKAFPLMLVEDFIGLFSPLQGTADADITVSGTRSEPSITGFLSIQNARGRFLFNNMEYLLGMRIEATGQDIRIVDASVKNVPSDWNAGEISASGTISTEAFSISHIDLSVKGRLQVLKPASRSALRSLYGSLYITTGGESLTWDGRLDRSKLIGDIIVEEGNLFMPLQQTEVGTNEYADFMYVTVDDTTKEVRSSLSSGRFSRARGEGGDQPAAVPERSVLEGLTYDLTLATRGTLRIEIPLTPLQEELNAALKIDNLKVNNWGGGGMKFVGEVELGKDSYYIFFGKRMTATGTLRFTRDPMNPDLNLEAVYSDFYDDPRSETERRRRVFVIITITGTKNQPELSWDMRWDDPEGDPVASAGDIESDAFSFLLFGMFARDFTAGEGDRGSLLDKSPELLNAVTSSLASSAATQFVKRAGLEDVVKRVEFEQLGTQESRVKVTGELGRAVIIYDGKVKDLGSSNVTAEFPVSRILGIPWTNLVIQVAYKSQDERAQSSSQPNTTIWELKLLERFSF